MRLQLALNVTDLDRSVDYYSKLFGSQPHKRKPGYANFVVDDPPLKLVLFENQNSWERLNHLGVEAESELELQQAVARLKGQGLIRRDPRSTTCCHATQDKVWSTEPDGMKWEWYRVTDDAPPGND